jgi:bifunctional enzyme CysN/CysC
MSQNEMDISKDQMRVVVVGHVDHGKSTIIGRLLVDTNSLPKGKLEFTKERCRKNAQPFELAFLIDALKDEQAQAITIDSARVFFQSKLRNYIIIDAPGHIEFIKNMVTGASHAEAALLVIDAEEGVQENSRRHGYLLGMLGIKKIVVLVNKMDLVEFQQDVFKNIVMEYSDYLSGIGVKALTYIPVSGREGSGVVTRGEKLSWYKGPTVLEALDSFEKTNTVNDLPLRLPVQDVYKFSNYGDSRRIIAGTISSGMVDVGDELVCYPSGKRIKIKTIESFNTSKQTTVQSGQAVGITMTEQIYIKRGQIISRSNDNPPFVSSRIRASIFWLGKQPLIKNKDYTLKLGTAHEKLQLEAIHKVIDASDYASQNRRSEIMHHDVAEVTFKLAHPIAFDTSEHFPETSRFVLVDDYEIRGGGIVLESLPDEDAQIREDVFTRNEKWIQSGVTMSLRAEKYNQLSSLVVITGPKGSGRKTLARKLESQLFDDGKFVYYLGLGSFLYGVNADLKRHDAPGGWREHVRRFAEVSHLFIDAGIIMIVTAIDLSQDDLDILKTVIDEDKVHVVWIGEKVTTDINYDLHLKSHNTMNEGVVLIKHLLQNRGIIFTP